MGEKAANDDETAQRSASQPRSPDARLHDDEDLVGRSLLHFRVIERLGAGGMGVVYRAIDEKLRRPVALKVLNGRLLADDRNKLLLFREARSAAAVNHPSIASIYELHDETEPAFIVMELVEGESLRARLGRGALPANEAIAIAREIASALAHAHATGLVHRDLKADNVMLTRDGRAKVLDFGLAKAAHEAEIAVVSLLPSSGHVTPHALAPTMLASSHPTEKGRVMGTPAYMSPEQARGIDVDARTDVFSFGVLVYEMLSGVLPFERSVATPWEWGGAGSPDWTPRAKLRDVPRAIDAVVTRCLAYARTERFESGANLEAALTEAMLERPARPRGRRIAAASVIAIAIVAAVVALRKAPRAIVTEAPTPAPVASATRHLTVRRMTANPTEHPIGDVALSPDGTRLAYVDPTGGYVRPVDAADAKRLTTPPGDEVYQVAWMPDGKRLLVESGPHEASEVALWMFDSAIAAPHLVAKTTYGILSVSADGTKAFLSGALGWLSLTGDDAGAVHLVPGFEKAAGAACVSRDERRIAYAKWNPSPRIESVSITGGPPVTIVEDPRLVHEQEGSGFAWLPDDRFVYSLADAPPLEQGANLFEVRLDHDTGRPLGPARQLTTWSGIDAVSLSASADGSRVAFIRGNQQTDVEVAAVSRGAPGKGESLGAFRRITMSDRNERPSSWTADSRAVYMTADNGGDWSVYRQPMDGSPPTQLIPGEPVTTWSRLASDGSLLFWSLPRWSSAAPYSMSLLRLLPSGDVDPSPLYTLTESAPRRARGWPPPMGDEGVSCTRTGRCLVAHDDGDSTLLEWLDPRTGRHEPFAGGALGDVFRWELSPDGTQLAILRGDMGTDIVAVSDRHLVHTVKKSLFSMGWNALGTGLYGLQWDGGGSRLLYEGLDGSESLLWEKRAVWAAHPVASPDGHWLALGVKQMDNDVWLLDGL